MSENKSKPEEWFVDPNSGAAPQPGGFVAVGVAVESAGANDAPLVPDNDPELPAKSGEEIEAPEGDPTEAQVPGQLGEGSDPDSQEGGEVPAEEEPTEEPGQPEPSVVAADAAHVTVGEDEAPEPQQEESKDYSELLKGGVKDVQKYLEEHPEEKDAVIEAEKAGQNRKTIVES